MSSNTVDTRIEGNAIIIRAISFALLTLLVMVTPIRGVLPLVFGRSISIVLAALLIPIWLYSVLSSSYKLLITRFHILVCVFFFWASISVYWSADQLTTAFESLYLSAYVILMVAIFNILTDNQRTRIVISSYLLTCFFLCLAIFSNYYQGVEWSSSRYSAFGMNPNHMGFYLALGIPLAGRLFFEGNKNRNYFSRKLGCMYVLVGAVGVLLTGSRGAIVAIIPALVFFSYLLSREVATNISVRTKWLIASIILIGVILFLPTEGIGQRIATIYTELKTLSIGGRFEIWISGFEVWRQTPLTGVGFAGFDEAVQPYLGYKVPPESSIIGLLYELGLIGYILILWAFKSISSKLSTSKIWVVFVITLCLLSSVNDWLEFPTLWILLSVMISDLYLGD